MALSQQRSSDRSASEGSQSGVPMVTTEGGPHSPQHSQTPTLRQRPASDRWPSILIHMLCVMAITPVIIVLDFLAFFGWRRNRDIASVPANHKDATAPTKRDFDLLDPLKCLSDETSVLLRGAEVRGYLHELFVSAGVPVTIREAFTR